MLYLGIDQHKRQLTVNLRGEDGSVILKRQVSTQWEKVRTFVTVHGAGKRGTGPCFRRTSLAPKCINRPKNGPVPGRPVNGNVRFFADLAEKAQPEGGFLAMLEVCGMNPWLLDMLREYGCREVVVLQPTGRSKQKTDRRDAGELSHW